MVLQIKLESAVYWEIQYIVNLTKLWREIVDPAGTTISQLNR
jgi:hypothetical protein